jgi:hypothetical protein
MIRPRVRADAENAGLTDERVIDMNRDAMQRMRAGSSARGGEFGPNA